MTGPARRAVVDRIVSELAVLLVGEEETELHVPVAALPEQAGEGSTVLVEETEDGVTLSVEESPEDDRVREALEERLARLRRTRPSRRLRRDQDG